MDTNSGVYTDFQGLARLRIKAAQNSPEALKKTAAQFEAIFIQMMLKSMRDASFGDGIFDSEQGKFYQEIYDKQIALDISSKGGLGLANMMIKQLGTIGKTDNPTTSLALNDLKIDDFLASRNVLNRFPATRVTHTAVQNNKSTIQQADRNTSEEIFKDPVDFVKAVWKHAKIAATALGLAPEVLAAQAALETGWGKFVIRDSNGNSSNNLFGVKAGKRWDGNNVSVSTLEFSDGLMKKENALFRAYNSIEDSFNDYVNFLKSNPRYQQALESGADNKLFTQELQRAGYATDPAYADKIINILNGDVFKQAVQGLTDFGVR